MTTVERHDQDAQSVQRRAVIETGSQLSINTKLKHWIDKIVADSADERPVPDDLKIKCQEYQTHPPRCIPLSVVQRIADYASERREQGKTPKARNVYLDDFFLGAKWFFAEGPAPQKRDRASESTVERIRNDAANREYARMTKNLGGLSSSPADNLGSFASDLKVANREALAAFNCLLTVVGAFVFSYFATGLAVEDNVILQVFVAVVVSTIVAIADIYFLLKKLHYDELKAESDSNSGAPKTPVSSEKKSKDV